ncbi:hypothetical protein K4K49_011905 [Colletotrichum sp. SAR 10_70]|nr:hypothetical protein K4K50_012113 [Colletotrichum sp. SAR 10_71]KAI8185620.1 hypothetical protein K4K51_011484 [Colletotrichum sp. SAR 10_75]KAI8191450.1 hypothetical protein K4K49_011905 [Colletotrichum sp. SAR 10_70]KAI8200151.1 hypothetical protein KHU50_007095 [Colletotrichum sp. SAR 10_65]KAI8208002.1 hypothetical protein K4K52_001837 [Colletotrichum sp. SAR 10_76]KAI8225690.1 hypothetical protein K4K54_004382 [Colletotrichum sp. SAR 10_86]KAI8252283.1 hypothetical protein K4K53_01134
MICPFCGIAGGGEYEMLTHMESFHPEEDQASSSQAAQEQYAECPIEGCGEVLSIAEMDYHVDLHVEEQRQGVGGPSEDQTADGTTSSRMTTEVGAMMVSYINGANAYGRDQFRGRLPTIFEIQEYIENAWDMGINAQGRLETGGIKGTRKYIGTPERSLSAFRYRHSLTIVGFERQKNGPSNLLVFDPMFRDAPALARLIGQTFKHRSADESLKPYRRGSKYLRRYREFEILRLDGSQLSPPQSSR